jgi:mutator protein MutT
MKQTFTIGVFGIIKNERNQVLLVLRQDYNLWNLPGGGLEQGETPWDGVAREVKEETGLDIVIDRLSGLYTKTDKNEIVFSFDCKVVGGKITLNSEAKEIKWFSINELPKNFSPKQAERIRDSFQNSGSLIMKIQTGQSSIDLVKEGKL